MKREVALVAAFALGCNGWYGLDETELALGDRDGDGVIDADDNCIDVANPDQANGDGDAFGDACDRCLEVASDSDHDEDGDGRPDPCDACPASNDFDNDTDDDGVGDACDLDAHVTTRLLFDPFLKVDPAWAGTGTWFASATDSLGRTEPPGPDDVLARTGIAVDGMEWSVTMCLVAQQRWQPGDRAGIFMRNAGGLTTCEVSCDETECRYSHSYESRFPSSFPAKPLPEVTFALLVTPVSPGTYEVRCRYDEARAAVYGAHVPASTSWTVGVMASPNLQVRYIDVLQ
jgi:hypothetical protein